MCSVAKPCDAVSGTRQESYVTCHAGQCHVDSDSSDEQPCSSARIKPMLLCGADMVESLADPGVWKPEHVRVILGEYGVVCISR